MLNRPIRNIHDFLLSTYFADGLRITFGVLCPSLVMAQFGMLEYGMTLSLGALCVSVVDAPGPIVHRRNAMLVTTALITVISVLVGLTNKNPYFTGALVILCSFAFSMLIVYGARAGAIGTAVLLVMVLSIDDVRPWKEVLWYAVLVFGGGIWYTLLSYSIYRLRPYRLVQQTLSDSIFELSAFLRAKARFYQSKMNYDENYKNLLQMQVVVHEKQEEVRELLFKTREIVRESTPEGRFLVLVFVDTVDLFEQIMSTYYDYKTLHEQFESQHVLHYFEQIIYKTADSIENIAFALKAGGRPQMVPGIETNIARLKEKILDLENNKQQQPYNALGLLALRNIELNIENILARVKTITQYFNKNEKSKLKKRDFEANRFVSRQDFGRKLFFENLTFSSAPFRHAVRVAIVMFIGFVVAKILDFAHSYWILLTILVISKPGFTLTKQRNYQRIIGTVIGAFIGMAVLVYIHDRNTLFVILLLCMIGSYSFQRKNYVVSVVFTTPYVLVLFDFLGMGNLSIARERIFDTLIGSGIATIASYALFPNWEHERLKQGMIDMIRANLNYFKQVTHLYLEGSDKLTEYKVARKELFVSTANLTSLFQRMFSEPKSKQWHIQEVHRFTVLHHSLSSYAATLSLFYRDHGYKHSNFEELKPITENTIYLLSLAMNYLEQPPESTGNVPLIRVKPMADNLQYIENTAVAEQFALIQQSAYDILKLVEKIRFSAAEGVPQNT